MIITCEKCYAKFNLDKNLLKQTGSKVRCSKCQNIFLAYLPTEAEKPAKPTEEMVGSETVEKEEPEEIDFELDLDTEPVTEKTPEEEKADLEIGEEELLDLSDIEKTLAIEETTEPETVEKEEPEEIDFELDLDTEPVTEKTLQEAEADLDFELEDVDEEKIKKEVAETVDLGRQTDQVKKEEVGKVKKRISTPVLVALIIALLAGGFYGTYLALKSMNIKIPFISNLVEPAVHDEAGNLKIIVFDITDKFIDNPTSGRLFIISGKVKNGYSRARSFIRVTGKIYTKERVLSKTATIYCGNVLSDQDLLNMDMNSINTRLLTPSGDNKSNINVKPDKLLQFMIVFSTISDDIKEYTVEVAGSSPA